MSRVAVSWSDREPPLVPSAVVAADDVARRLARRLLEFDATTLKRLTGVAGKTTLVLLGEESVLPWVDGVHYLGSDPLAPTLLLPTRLQPVIPAANILEKAIQNRFPQLLAPIAVLSDARTVISAHHALPLSRNRIEEWLGEGQT